ncbi:MAG: hypothetical protein CMM93_03715 [Rickettsiales bacterium]|nr:hypothetical protein [Rickettsiales bacterium]|tara:strand:+ start:737 stop:1309 length:573 start_codon:yes stop_codon:yes gene_type:complete
MSASAFQSESFSSQLTKQEVVQLVRIADAMVSALTSGRVQNQGDYQNYVLPFQAVLDAAVADFTALQDAEGLISKEALLDNIHKNQEYNAELVTAKPPARHVASYTYALAFMEEILVNGFESKGVGIGARFRISPEQQDRVVSRVSELTGTATAEHIPPQTQPASQVLTGDTLREPLNARTIKGPSVYEV